MTLRTKPIRSTTFEVKELDCTKITMATKSGYGRVTKHNYQCGVELSWSGISKVVAVDVQHVSASEDRIVADDGGKMMKCYIDDWGSKDYSREPELHIVCRGSK